MPPSIRPSALALCIVLALAAVTGCGQGDSAGGGTVTLTITADYGATSIAPPITRRLPAAPGLDAMVRRYRQPNERESLFVNGIAADAPAATGDLHNGDRVWLDRRGSNAAPRISAVIGSFPEPFVHGIGGKRLPVRVECDDPRSGPCAAVADKLVSVGVVAGRSIVSHSAADATLRVLVGPWKRLRDGDIEAQHLAAGPHESGVFARFTDPGDEIVVLNPGGLPERTLGAGTGLIAATVEGERQPVWFVTGTDGAGVAAAARAFDESVLADRYALVISRDLPVAVPMRATER